MMQTNEHEKKNLTNVLFHIRNSHTSLEQHETDDKIFISKWTIPLIQYFI